MFWQSQAKRRARVCESRCMPSGPIDEIRLFVWRSGDWHPLPEEQQAQIKECLKRKETVFRVSEGGQRCWTLDTTGRGGWMQVRPARRRPVKFVEPQEPHLSLSLRATPRPRRGGNMRKPLKGDVVMEALEAEWESVAGLRESLHFHELVEAWTSIASCAGAPTQHAFLMRHREAVHESSTDEELVQGAVEQLWLKANLLPHEPLGQEDWLHLRLLEIQAPSQFAVLALSEALHEQAMVRGNSHYHRRLLQLFMLACEDNGRLSLDKLRDLISEAQDGRTGAGQSQKALQPLCRNDHSPPKNGGSSPLLSPREGEQAPPQQQPPQQRPPQQALQQSSPSLFKYWPLPKMVPCTGGCGSGCQRFDTMDEDEEPMLRQFPKDWQQDMETFLCNYNEGEDFVTYYDYLNHMLERKQCPVMLHQYDLSAGKAKWLSPMLLCSHMEGIWHTGVVVFDREYWYGGHIFESKIGQTPYGKPTKVINMGEQTMRSRQELWHFVQRELQFEFTMYNYDVLTNNCNHFSDAVCSFLINQHIPEDVLRQPQQVMRTPVVSLVRAVLNRQLGQFDSRGTSQHAYGQAVGRLGAAARGPHCGTAELTRSTCTLSAEEEWEQIQEGELVIYEYEPGWTSVARVDSKDAEACDLHWLDARCGCVNIEEEVPPRAVRLLPGSGGARERARAVAMRNASCVLCG